MDPWFTKVTYEGVFSCRHLVVIPLSVVSTQVVGRSKNVILPGLKAEDKQCGDNEPTFRIP